MAFADDFTLDRQTGNIRHASGSTNYTVLDLHRYIGALADDASSSGNDEHDITDVTGSDRSTDNIITLNDYTGSGGIAYNIDDDAAEYLYDGSITQYGGDEVYSGLRVLGAVNNSSTQLKVIQDNDEYQYTTTPASPFWGDQSTDGYNGDAVAGILMRCLIKSRTNGADIDNQIIRVQARHWGDTYAFFNTTLGQGEAVAAISTTPDAQNDTVQGTVQGWAGGDIPTNTEGWQEIDLSNGSGLKEYYSQWTYNTNSDELKAIWEWGKDITNTGTASTIHGLVGEFFLGITHSWAYDAESGNFTEDETLVWGTDITYDGLAGGTFSAGDYVTIGSGGAAGRVMYDSGTTNMIVALEDTSITINDNDVITEASAGTVTADATATIVDNDKSGGSAILLALDDDGTTGNMYVQVVTGSAPVDDLSIRGITSTETTLVNGTPAAKTVPSVFLGSYTGSFIGAYGIGFDPDDLTASDTVQPLVGGSETPPNNVTFTVFGVISGDRILVTNDEATGVDYDQNTLNGVLSSGTTTSVVVTNAIDADTPTTGTIRIERDSGTYTSHPYSSYTGSTYTITSADFSVDGAADTNNVFNSYLDLDATGTSEAFTTVYDSARTLFVRVRDGGATPIKTFETTASLGTSGGSATAIRTSDA